MASSENALVNELGAEPSGKSVWLTAGDIEIMITSSMDRAVTGQEIGVIADFLNCQGMERFRATASDELYADCDRV